ncbi:MAG: carbohydrate binding family 9 domain-containing protein, partial [Gemmatimonadetes bacterium]|nr:carbohydrate binding family 9 domain-containing protein [Gemmatimonadota bacterium]
MRRTPTLWSASLLFTLALVGPARATAQAATAVSAVPSPTTRKELVALPAGGPIRLDGVLDEEVWKRAPGATGFVQSEPREGQPATEQTEVFVAFDADNLYIGAFMRDSDPSREIVNDIRKDFREDDQDDFEVILDTFHDRRNGYVFITNPAGGRVDRQIANEGREINSSWDAIWDVKTHRSADGWTAEMRIPFRTLRFVPGADQPWGINFSRRIRRKNEVTFWSPVPRSFNLMRLSLAGDVTGLKVGAAGRDLRLKPYLLGNTVRDVGVTAHDQKFDAGLDMKFAVTRGLTLDGTIRPDFAQVEADEQQVNLTQFAQFFPEKREAFLENSGMFYVGDAARLNRVFLPATPDDDNLLFFSRRIGIRNDRKPLPIDAGARLTGMAGGFGIGLINMQVRGDDVTDANNYTVVRLRRNVSRGSDIGVLFMQRQSTENADNYNRVAGIDANIRFLGRLDWNSYFIGTRTPGRTEGQYSARTSLNWEGNFFHGKGGVMSLGENFNNDLGFYRRTGVKKWFADIGVRPRPEALRKRGIRELHPHIVWDLFTDQGNHMVQKRLHTGQSFFFENGAVVELSYNPAFNLLDRPLRLSPKADPLPAGPYSWQEWGILANTDQSRRVS